MPSFARAIREAYLEILGREADPGGLASWDRNMNLGLSEAEMREALLRSPEYAVRNPGLPLRERLGLNGHIPSDAILEDIARNLRVRWIRVDFDWFRIQPEQGSFHWEEWDRVVLHASERGLEVLRCFTPLEPLLGNKEISVRTGLPKPTVSRLMAQCGIWYFFDHNRDQNNNISTMMLGAGSSKFDPCKEHGRALDPERVVRRPQVAGPAGGPVPQVLERDVGRLRLECRHRSRLSPSRRDRCAGKSRA